MTTPMASLKQIPYTSFNFQPGGFRGKPATTLLVASLKRTPQIYSHSPPPLPSKNFTFQQSFVPLSACLAILLWSFPANAGFLSGYGGIESVPGPELPRIDFLNRWNDDNQKKYAEDDTRFKNSPILKELLEKSKQNKEKNRKLVEDKYCLRGAEWGVGDCSTAGMTEEERDSFISMLKKKAGVEE